MKKRFRQVEFITANRAFPRMPLGNESNSKIHPLGISSITFRFDPAKRRYAGKTENVARLALSVKHIQGDRPPHHRIGRAELEECGTATIGPSFPGKGRGTLVGCRVTLS